MFKCKIYFTNIKLKEEKKKILLEYLFYFQEHSGRVFRLQFDEFQIVSSSHDDTILIWDFLNVEPPEGSSRSPVRTYTYVSK